MQDPITPFGRRWEIRHSLWIVWVFTPLAITSFISFFYIGARAKMRKWTIAGVIYLVLPIIGFYIAGITDEENIVLDLAAGLVLTLWLISCIHAFSARRQYLRILAQKIIDSPSIPTPPILVKTTYPFNLGHQSKPKPTSLKNIKKKTSLPIRDEEKPFMLNINKASLKRIASHPYIGNIVARQIVQVRDEVGEFKSYKHFVESTNIKPHVLGKAKPYLVFNENDKKKQDNDKSPKQPTPKKTEYRSGRIVDY